MFIFRPELISDKGQHSSALVDSLRVTNRDESGSTFGKKLVADEDSTVYDPFKVQEILTSELPGHLMVS